MRNGNLPKCLAAFMAGCILASLITAGVYSGVFSQVKAWANPDTSSVDHYVVNSPYYESNAPLHITDLHTGRDLDCATANIYRWDNRNQSTDQESTEFDERSITNGLILLNLEPGHYSIDITCQMTEGRREVELYYWGVGRVTVDELGKVVFTDYQNGFKPNQDGVIQIQLSQTCLADHFSGSNPRSGDITGHFCR